jgi:hypothetical protein
LRPQAALGQGAMMFGTRSVPRLLSLTLKALNFAAQGTARVPAARGRYPGADSYHIRFTPKALHIGTKGVAAVVV